MRFAATGFTGRVCGASLCLGIMRNGASPFGFRMKILRSTHTVNPALGGPIESIKQSSAALVRRGHQVEIISLDAATDPWVRDAPVRVHALGPGLGGYGYAPPFSRLLKQHRTEYDT